MAPSRVRAPPAAVWPSAVAAGSIESSSGSASDTPTPRRNVRRERWDRVRKAMCSFSYGSGLRLPGAQPEQGAFDDTLHERREPLVVAPRGAHDLAHRGHVLG